jgi:hypothetical protein
MDILDLLPRWRSRIEMLTQTALIKLVGQNFLLWWLSPRRQRVVTSQRAHLSNYGGVIYQTSPLLWNDRMKRIQLSHFVKLSVAVNHINSFTLWLYHWYLWRRLWNWIEDCIDDSLKKDYSQSWNVSTVCILICVGGMSVRGQHI